MTLVSRFAFPALIGGLIAVLLSGVFSPPAQARGYAVDTIARVTGVSSWDHLNVRRWPAHYSQQVGSFSPMTLVWIERCIEVDNSSDWCLVERAGIKGWVNSRYLSVQN